MLALVRRLGAPLRLNLDRPNLAMEGERSHPEAVIVCLRVKVVEIFQRREKV